MLKYFQRKRERERERERKCVSLSCFKQTRRERENKERNKKCIIPRETRERRFCVGSHVPFLHRLFGGKKKKLSFLSLFGRFDRHLSHHHRVVSIFPLLTRARTQSRRFRKKNARERGFDTWKTSSLARNCTRARRVPFAFPSFTLKNKIKHTPTPHHHEKSLHELTFCLSVKEKNENAKSKSSLEIHPQKPTRDA